VLIAFEDTGPGIPDHIRDRLFEPFVTGGKPEGLGLGLALARQTLRSRGGDIWAEPATGARFVIRLPVERAHRAITRRRNRMVSREQPGPRVSGTTQVSKRFSAAPAR
jgi:nitrogen-specific signal transduction histidine kinase